MPWLEFTFEVSERRTGETFVFDDFAGSIGDPDFEAVFGEIDRSMMRHHTTYIGGPRMSACAKVTPFVPTDFVTPEGLETSEFRLRMLSVNDVVKDYDAVMSSVDHCRTIWPGGKWPEGLTLEQNLIDLGWHQKEFQTRRSFAYTVVNLSGSKVIGCVYVDPTRKRGHDAEVYLWARQSELAGGLEDRLYVAIKEWIAKDWPFKSAAFPGRDIAWKNWREIPNEKR